MKFKNKLFLTIFDLLLILLTYELSHKYFEGKYFHIRSISDQDTTLYFPVFVEKIDNTNPKIINTYIYEYSKRIKDRVEYFKNEINKNIKFKDYDEIRDKWMIENPYPEFIFEAEIGTKYRLVDDIKKLESQMVVIDKSGLKHSLFKAQTSIELNKHKIDIEPLDESNLGNRTIYTVIEGKLIHPRYVPSSRVNRVKVFWNSLISVFVTFMIVNMLIYYLIRKLVKQAVS